MWWIILAAVGGLVLGGIIVGAWMTYLFAKEYLK